MPFGAAIIAIVSLFLAGWAVIMARNPKRWRLWWLSSLRIVDVQSTKEQRRTKEGRLAVLAYVAFTLFLAAALSCGYWTWRLWEFNRGPKSEYDQSKDKTFRDVEKMNQNKPFKKLND